MKERVEREFKEMNECKKPLDKKNERCKRSAVGSKTAGADDASKTCDQTKKKDSNTRNFTDLTWGLKSALKELSFLSPIGRLGVVRESPMTVRLIPISFRPRFRRYARKLINFDLE